MLPICWVGGSANGESKGDGGGWYICSGSANEGGGAGAGISGCEIGGGIETSGVDGGGGGVKVSGAG
jgi:hypothetical protein